MQALDLTVERGHITASVAARIMGVSRQRVNQLLQQNKLDGAFLIDCGDGREVWCIPRRSVLDRQPRNSHKTKDRPAYAQ